MSTQGNTASRIDKDSVVFSNLFRKVGQDGVLDAAEASLLSGLVVPSQMRKVRIDRTGYYLTVVLGESCSHVRKSDKLSGAHEGKVQWVEEKTGPFSLLHVSLEGNFLEGTVDDSLACECGGGLGHFGIASGRASECGSDTTEHSVRQSKSDSKMG